MTMQIKEFVAHLCQGELVEAMGVDVHSLVDFIKGVVFPRTDFILCVTLSCGCVRITHYSVLDLELIVQADGNSFRLVLQSETTVPREAQGCKQPEIRMSWSNLPIVGINVEWTHEEYDTALRNRR